MSDSEGFNWKAFLSLIIVALAWYGYSGYKPKQEPTINNNDIDRDYAFSICEQVCQRENNILLDAMKNKGYVESGTADFIKEQINYSCSDECKNRVYGK